MQKYAASFHFQAGKQMSLCLLPSPVFPSFPPSFDPTPCGNIKRVLNILAPVKYLYYKARKEIGASRPCKHMPGNSWIPGSAGGALGCTAAPFQVFKALRSPSITCGAGQGLQDLGAQTSAKGCPSLTLTFTPGQLLCPVLGKGGQTGCPEPPEDGRGLAFAP